MIGLEATPVGPILTKILYSHHESCIEVKDCCKRGEHPIATDEVEMPQHVQDIRLDGIVFDTRENHSGKSVGKFLPLHGIILHPRGLNDTVYTVMGPHDLLSDLLLACCVHP